MEDCLFCKIIEKKIPADILYEDENALAFKDINPCAPVHFLVIPKTHIATMNDADESNEKILGHLMTVAAKVAKDLGIAEPGYRSVVNTNRHAGQVVFHIHMHVVAGKQFGWPPG